MSSSVTGTTITLTRGRTVMEGMQMEKMTIDEWLKHIMAGDQSTV